MTHPAPFVEAQKDVTVIVLTTMKRVGTRLLADSMPNSSATEVRRARSPERDRGDMRPDATSGFAVGRNC